MRTSLVVSLLIFVVLALVSAGVVVTLMPYLSRAEIAGELAGVAPVAAKPLVPTAQYFPPGPGAAPPSQQKQVLRGQDLLANTRTRLASDVGNSLSCNSCHFASGLSSGGRNNGFSLVGVAAAPPSDDMPFDLEARIDTCFRRNLDGHAPAHGSVELEAMLAYLRWISSGIPYLTDVPWLKPQPLAGDRPADPEAGQQTERQVCAPCHGDHGQGTRIAPATHGPASFTGQSNLLAVGVLERFLYDNMPRGNPNLSVQAAADAAAYLRGQARPNPK